MTGRHVKSTSFADFFRNASSAEKKRVYEEVLDKANKAQSETLKKTT